MIRDENPVLRQLCWKKIQVPEINSEGNVYDEMTNQPNNNAEVCHKSIDYADPPMIHMIKDDQVDELTKSSALPM